MQESFTEVVNNIYIKDPRYSPDSYFFIKEALDFTLKIMKKSNEGPERHITGQELLEGIRKYTIQEFGPIALTVLNTWGIKKTEDFGEIVFNLVATGKLGKTDKDKKEDFADCYDFYDAFAKPFLPKPTIPARRKKVKQRT